LINAEIDTMEILLKKYHPNICKNIIDGEIPVDQ